MKKYVIGAVVFAVLLVIIFFGFSLVRANIYDRTLPEEWRSWLPKQEQTTETEETTDTEEIPGTDEEITLNPVTPEE